MLVIFETRPVELLDCPYSSPGVPEGWNTVLGYLVDTNPEAMRFMDEDAEATQRCGWWLSARCKRLGITPIKVMAPSILLKQGIFEVNAYPHDLLEARFG
jgi:hypothetical protein